MQWHKGAWTNKGSFKIVLNQHDITATVIVDGFLEDALLCVNSILEKSQVNIYLLINGKQGFHILENLSPRIHINFVKQKLGWSNAVNLMLDEIQTDYVVLMDPSTRFIADPFPLVIEQLTLGYQGVGWRGGLVDIDDDWRSVINKGPGEVDVLFSYFMVLNRKFVQQVGANPSAKYYRNADLEFSLAIREIGGRLVEIELPLIQERHHGYHDVDSAYREKHSKENYQRLLKRFRGNLGILAPRR